MKQRIKLTFILVFLSNSIFSQLLFSEEKELTTDFFTHNVIDIIESDLNNDGYKDLIVSLANRKIFWYKNVNGDLQYSNPYMITEDFGIEETYDNGIREIAVGDLDGDGLKDIIAISRIGKRLSWFKNMGNDLFSNEIIIQDTSFSPGAVKVGDFNNDGFEDIIVGAYNNNFIYLYSNTGTGTFSQPTTINSDLTSKINKLYIYDFDNDGLLDIFTVHESNMFGKHPLRVSKNLGNNNFATNFYVTDIFNSNSKIDFLDVNNDGFNDLIVVDNNSKLSCFFNQNGLFFSNATVINNTQVGVAQIKIKDFDNDGFSDIIICYENQIGWHKNNGNGTFNYTTIINDISTYRILVVEDINNDGELEIISHISNNNTSGNLKQKISLYSKNLGIYKETILETRLGAIGSIRIADLNNDGLNDIILGHGLVCWHKNLGNGNFSSFKLVDNDITNTSANYIELADFNNDGLLDIVAVSNNFLRIFKNKGNEKFDLAFTIPSSLVKDIEVGDFNQDGKVDFMVVYTNGTTRLGYYENLGDFNFNDVQTILTNYNFVPHKIKVGDIDNDGDIDIAVASTSAFIFWLQNDGNANFSPIGVQAEIQSDMIELVDLDNDGYLDIISGGDYTYSPEYLYWVKNNNGVFEQATIIDNNQSAKTIICADINNDGYKDLIGLSIIQNNQQWEETLFYYTFNGNSFENKTIIAELGDKSNGNRDLYAGDLNNDGKMDIAISYAYFQQSGYFLNTSTLSNNNEFNENYYSIKMFPNPTFDKVYWVLDNSSEQYKVNVYSELGQLLIEKVNNENNFIDISHLPHGIYFVQIKSNHHQSTKKIVKK